MAQSHIQINKSPTEPLVTTLTLSLFTGLTIFVLIPLFMVMRASVFKDGIFDLSPYKNLISEAAFIKPLINSLKLGAATATLGAIVGYAFAYILVMTSIPLKQFFRMVATFPMISPPFIIAIAAIMLLGQNGVITKILIPYLGEGSSFSVYGFWGLLLVEVLAYFPTAFLLLVGFFSSVDPVLEEAAQNQGAGLWRTFKDVIFPLSIPAILSSWLLIFIESLADFGNPLILSGDFKVLSVEAYLKITGQYDMGGGAILAILLLFPSLLAFFIQKYYVNRKSYVTLTGKPSTSKRQNSSVLTRSFLFLLCFCFTAPILVFYAAIIYGSFVKTWGVTSAFTLQNYTLALSESWEALRDSLILAAIATPITGILGMIVAYLLIRKTFFGKTALEVISLLTFAVPGTVVGIGYILAFNDKPLLLTGTASIIVLLFIFRNAPVGIQAGTTALRQIDKSIEEASSSLGAGSFTTFYKVVLPLLAPAFFSGLAYSFVRSVTAISAVIFVVSGQWNLVTVAILGFVENSYLSRASAMCMVLVVFVAVILGAMQVSVARMGVRQ
jgi:iron(III) transport system permease protein